MGRRGGRYLSRLWLHARIAWNVRFGTTRPTGATLPSSVQLGPLRFHLFWQFHDKAYKSRKRSAEVYSYLVARKAEGVEVHEASNRILSTPLKRNKHILVDLCCSNGSFERRVYTKGKMMDKKEEYRTVRKSEWGGILSV